MMGNRDPSLTPGMTDSEDETEAKTDGGVAASSDSSAADSDSTLDEVAELKQQIAAEADTLSGYIGWIAFGHTVDEDDYQEAREDLIEIVRKFDGDYDTHALSLALWEILVSIEDAMSE